MTEAEKEIIVKSIVEECGKILVNGMHNLSPAKRQSFDLDKIDYVFDETRYDFHAAIKHITSAMLRVLLKKIEQNNCSEARADVEVRKFGEG